MSSVATADWVRAERRKQNAAVLAVIIACLLVAFFPRNERRLFTFPGETGFFQTITAPLQTHLRQSVFDGLSGLDKVRPRGERPGPAGRFERVLPLSEPLIEFPPLIGPHLPLMGEPMRFDFDLPGPDPQVPPGFFNPPPPAPWFNGPPPVSGAVPEPATWVMMIGGIALFVGRIRFLRYRARKRRRHRRWRQGLVPAPVPLRVPPLASLGLPGVPGPGAGLRAGLQCAA